MAVKGRDALIGLLYEKKAVTEDKLSKLSADDRSDTYISASRRSQTF